MKDVFGTCLVCTVGQVEEKRKGPGTGTRVRWRGLMGKVNKIERETKERGEKEKLRWNKWITGEIKKKGRDGMEGRISFLNVGAGCCCRRRPSPRPKKHHHVSTLRVDLHFFFWFPSSCSSSERKEVEACESARRPGRLFSPF